MADYLKEDEPMKQSIDSYEKSELILSVFFGILDLCCICFICYLNSINKKVIKLKINLFKLLGIDFTMRLFYTRKYSSWTIYKEIFYTLMSTVQFYLIITFIILVWNNKKNNINENLIFFECCIFFLVTFEYEYISLLHSTNSSKFILNIIPLIQSLCILFSIYKSSGRITEVIGQIAYNLKRKFEKYDNLNKMISGSPQSSIFLFSLYYILKIILFFIKNQIYRIYANVILMIIKEDCKYFVFFISLIIVYQLNKLIINDEEKTLDSQSEEKIQLKN
jgi:hypothetical protein